MKLCIPVKENKGLKSSVYSHFGSSSAFIIYDTDNENIEVLDNSDQNHVHGQCHPTNSINGKNIEAIIVGGIGTRAINKLQANNIKVYKSEPGTVEHNLNLFKKSLLPELTENDACVHNNSGNGCNN
jgi:predicted Fe-Mo cluster-binding NifX family protein